MSRILKLSASEFKTTMRRKWQLIPVFLPGESHGQRSLGSQRVRHNLANTHSLMINILRALTDKIDGTQEQTGNGSRETATPREKK